VKSGESKLKCWGCGLLGHKRGDAGCKAEANSLHESAPVIAKRKFNSISNKTNDGGPNVKKPDGLCRFFSKNGTCKFGANCKFEHAGGGKLNPTKKARFSKQQKKQVNALKANVTREVHDLGQDEIDELVRGFLTVRLVPTETNLEYPINVQAFETSLLDMGSFAYDTGAGEGISTSKDDFVYLDTSTKSKKSVKINGPSVGSPMCEGRGPLVYLFKDENKLMALIHPNGIYASSGENSPSFRLASAMQMKKLGIRYVGGKFNDKDTIECVRTGVSIPTVEVDGILTIKTCGSASDIVENDEFRILVGEIEKGVRSPMVEITPFLRFPFLTKDGCSTHIFK
jgi:hypothetical protein